MDQSTERPDRILVLFGKPAAVVLGGEDALVTIAFFRSGVPKIAHPLDASRGDGFPSCVGVRMSIGGRHAAGRAKDGSKDSRLTNRTTPGRRIAKEHHARFSLNIHQTCGRAFSLEAAKNLPDGTDGPK